MALLLHYLPLIIIALIVLICIIIYAIREPKKVKEWLIFACMQAEQALGSGTGQLKLHQVYDAFISHYPLIALIISYDTFASWVSEALEKLEEMIETNEQINKLFGENSVENEEE